VGVTNWYICHKVYDEPKEFLEYNLKNPMYHYTISDIPPGVLSWSKLSNSIYEQVKESIWSVLQAELNETKF